MTTPERRMAEKIIPKLGLRDMGPNTVESLFIVDLIKSYGDKREERAIRKVTKYLKKYCPECTSCIMYITTLVSVLVSHITKKKGKPK